MIELIKDQQPTYMAVKRPKRMAVVGADLDIALCSSLTAGDKILMEVNGARVYSTSANPMVVEHPWEVVSNDYEGETKGGKLVRHTGHLVLRHPNVESEFRLAYDSVVAWKDSQKRDQPCVFVEMNDQIGEGTLYVILQMVAYYVPENVVEDLFPSPGIDVLEQFQDALDDDRVKVGLMEDWHQGFKTIGMGWGYLNDFRIVSLANARVNIVRAMKDGDYKTMLTATDDELMGLNRAIHWIPILIENTGLVAHSETVYEYRTVA
jgi:hypothetical protein